MISAPEGLYVYAPMIERIGEVRQEKTGWHVIDIDTGLVAMREEDLVIPTSHAINRWTSRIGDPDIPVDERMMAAWSSGMEMDPDDCGLEGDEVRWAAVSGAVMIRRGNALVTVIGPGGMKDALEEKLAGAEM